MKAFLLNTYAHRFQKYSEIEPKAPVIAVFFIIFHLFHKRNTVSAFNLSKTGKTRSEAVNAVFKAQAVCPYLT